MLGLHRHRDLGLMYFTCGTWSDRLGEHAFEVSADDILLVTSGIVHNASGLRDAEGWAVDLGRSEQLPRPSWPQAAPLGGGDEQHPAVLAAQHAREATALDRDGVYDLVDSGRPTLSSTTRVSRISLHFLPTGMPGATDASGS